jgi:hypothetical protein
MQAKPKKTLPERVERAAVAALKAHQSVSPLDVLLGIGWLDPNTARRWHQGQIDYLERTLQVDRRRLLEALRLLQSWAQTRGLVQSETSYVARTPQPPALRFSESGDPKTGLIGCRATCRRASASD